MTELALDSSAKETPAGARRRLNRRNVKTTLIILGALLVSIGIGLFAFAYKISTIDTYSVKVMLSEDRMGQESLADFRFTSWREPAAGVRPFVHGPKSFEECEIIQYRWGSRSKGLFRYTYYEAQYQMPDGSTVIGPAFGPRPYTAPNLFVFVPLIVGGAMMLVVGIALRVDRSAKSMEC